MEGLGGSELALVPAGRAADEAAAGAAAADPDGRAGLLDGGGEQGQVVDLDEPVRKRDRAGGLPAVVGGPGRRVVRASG